MNRNQVAASVAKNKESHPERYCPAPRCLWSTGGGYCPRHKQAAEVRSLVDDSGYSQSEALKIVRAGGL